MTRALGELPNEALAMHMHDTRGTALANIVVGLELGIRNFDASVGGMGGCPYAPGATGNVCTEDLIYLLDELGVPSGVDLAALIDVARLVRDTVGHDVPSRMLRAGPRPRLTAAS